MNLQFLKTASAALVALGIMLGVAACSKAPTGNAAQSTSAGGNSTQTSAPTDQSSPTGAAVPGSAEREEASGTAPTTQPPGSELKALAEPAVEIKGLFITAKALREELASDAAPTLVDVRNEERYEAFRIPNAIALRPVELAHAAPTRAGRAVIVTAGHGADGVAERVAALREEGRDVAVLSGGMQAWCRLGGDTSMPCRGADRMEPAELMRVVGEPDRLAVVMLRADDELLAEHIKRAESLLPSAPIITWSDASEAATTLAQRVTEADARQVNIVDADGVSYDELRGELQKKIDAHIFFVDVGLRGVAGFQESQKAMESRRTIVSQGVPGGGPGSTRPAVVRSPKGCGCQ